MSGLIVGVDPSLTSTGLAVWDGERFHTAAFPSKPPPHATLLEQHDRMDAIHSRIRERLSEWGFSGNRAIVATEELPKTGMSRGSLDRFAHVWRVLDTIRLHLSVDAAFEVNPSSLKLISTGYGKADKADMLDMAEGLYGVRCRTDDEADAVHVAAVAAACAGRPIPGWVGDATPDRAKSFAKVKAVYEAAGAGRW